MQSVSSRISKASFKLSFVRCGKSERLSCGFMIALNPQTPLFASGNRSALFVLVTPAQNAQSTKRQFLRAWSTLAFKFLTDVVAGIENLPTRENWVEKTSLATQKTHIGLSTIVVKPPAAAALVRDENPSMSVPEQMLTFASINPGMITLPVKS